MDGCFTCEIMLHPQEDWGRQEGAEESQTFFSGAGAWFHHANKRKQPRGSELLAEQVFK